MAATKHKNKNRFKYAIRRIVLLLFALGIIIFLSVHFVLKSRNKTEPLILDSASSEASSNVEVESHSEPDSSSEPQPTGAEAAANQGDWSLLLVNSKNPLPQDMVVETERVGEYLVNARIAEPLMRMIADARADGIVLTVVSGYRTEAQQTALFEEQQKEYASHGSTQQSEMQQAAEWVAPPGESEHQTGLAVDILTPLHHVFDDGFAKTPAYAWLSFNAYKYGFILRYAENKTELTGINYEPWHYRYVGPDAATIIWKNGYCLEEYIYVKDYVGLPDISDLEADSDASAGETMSFPVDVSPEGSQ